ncbi:MAG: XTP/dITP diphosphatase [Chloroflexota bacterium]|nr:MAG: XTP/dITP diphosphatase [Chloroflexota bacterium]
MKLLVATRNKGKVAELADMLADLQIKWLGLEDIPGVEEVAETGQTFEENAKLKASGYAAQSGLLTLADDSGLEVDALDDRPGVHTARYGGEGLSPVQRYELLLEELRGVRWPERKARFRCVVALSTPTAMVGTASGVCEGVIALESAGEGGFGYDPIFYLPDKGRTMAQLAAGEKHRISHRGRAFAAITPLLRKILAGD